MTPTSNTTAEDEVRILQRIIDTISYNLDIDDVLSEIIQVVDSVAQADEVFLYLLRDGELALRAAKREVAEEIRKIHMPLGVGITGWVAEHNEVVRLAERAYEDDRFYLFPNLEADKYESFLSLPLVYKGEVIGVLNVEHKDRYVFSDREVALLESVATATAGAIVNARLFEEATELQEQLRTRKVIERAKGALMQQRNWTEEEAYRWMKKRAMDLRKPMHEVAEAVLVTVE